MNGASCRDLPDFQEGHHHHPGPPIIITITIMYIVIIILTIIIIIIIITATAPGNGGGFVQIRSESRLGNKSGPMKANPSDAVRSSIIIIKIITKLYNHPSDHHHHKNFQT